MCFFDRRVGADRSATAFPAAAIQTRPSRVSRWLLAPLAAALLAAACGSDRFEPNDSTLTLSVATHNFGALAIGARSPVLAITASNSGSSSTGTISVALSGQSSSDFVLVRDLCSGLRLAGGGSCTIEVEVIPSASGLRQALLTVSGAEGERATATLSGTGSSSGLSLSPTVVRFDEVAVGQTGALKTVLVRNTAVIATGALSVSVTGGGASAFTITRDLCSLASLERSASCAIDIRFAPQVEGSLGATLSVAGVSAPSRSVQLLGVARHPTTLTVSPPGSHTFSGVMVGSSSPGATFVIRNVGTQASGPLGVQLGGANPPDFQIVTDGCYPNLAAGAACSLTVTFSPLATGTRSASVSISDPLGSSVAIILSGEGLAAPAPPIPLTLVPGGSLTFPTTLIGASVSQSVTVTNPGPAATGPLNTSVLVCDYYYYGCYPSATFTLSADTCDGVSLSAGGSCSVSIRFSPTFVGTDGAEFHIDAAGHSGALGLSGSGVGLHPSVSGVEFPPTPVGTASASSTVVITNTGATPTGTLETEISGFVFEKFSDTCAGTVLAPGGFCTIAVRFEPTSAGGRFGSLGISAMPGGTLQIQLYGVGL
ncbi:MAG: choice-of-anchor D domain-containing protein [Gemmatimonadota bacterium]